MIIQCESCSRKFQVKDEDIPQEGRTVQCSNCSQKWFQVPVEIQSSITPDIDKKVSKKEFISIKEIITKSNYHIFISINN